MHKCTHSAAGGTIHRLKPGFAIVLLRSRKLIALPSLGPQTFFFSDRARQASLPPSLLIAQCGWAFIESIKEFLSFDRNFISRNSEHLCWLRTAVQQIFPKFQKRTPKIRGHSST